MPGTQQKEKRRRGPGKGRERNVGNSAVQKNAKPYLQGKCLKVVEIVEIVKAVEVVKVVEIVKLVNSVIRELEN